MKIFNSVKNLIQKKQSDLSDNNFFTNKIYIKNWLDKYYIRNYTINNDLSVDVKGNVDISSENLEIIPIRFGSVTGNFWCNNNRLISLVGSPKSVGGSFSCNHNRLITLTGAPRTVSNNFYCNSNKLINLTNSPIIVTGNFYCNKNQLTSLVGSPESVGGDFSCSHNKLIDLVGVPKTIGGDFWCKNNQLISFLEIINCNFKKDFYFNIDEKNFKQKALIQILEKYRTSRYKHYELTNRQFYALIKPQIEKVTLHHNLNKTIINSQIKKNFL